MQEYLDDIMGYLLDTSITNMENDTDKHGRVVFIITCSINK
jgi:hypothetical protein